MSTQRATPRRGVYILPNLFTTASLFSGFLGLIWAAQGNFEGCAMAVLFSALMDGLDGKVARLTNTASEFGVQYDSLVDLVAFCVVPAFMIYMWHLQDFGRLGIAVAFLFAACGALRLARFNISTAVTPKKFFIGLPTPAGGCTLATMVFFAPYLPEYLQDHFGAFALGATLITSFLMVSRVRYASFKEYGFLKAHPFSSMVSAILIFVLVASEPKLLGFLVFAGYIISGPVYTFAYLSRRSPKLLNDLSS
ncbi:CDP-diacylglycerol--serine O-phosphatidyltransferase [Desulfovibrio psychrotolerans]|uniref:CDP-diacylglycerol--serine O-phosphatidyltransferase n=1 Tax=Desulfovibrio psychrotolerans TaxID=415242 RepID=A0A7J0BY27_9BACT|nr:CDP-diacylglycerol--serine O-phosphatidyltransferase [Desulfovibrio psychrotolerans]GFM37904.1 CDP-diacylglycerol--serine O-phosphatidyltransferase [Desulfovibrio psychrotolerans]